MRLKNAIDGPSCDERLERRSCVLRTIAGPGMSHAAVILLEQARATRERADRARRLAKSISTEKVVKELSAYADELEQSANALEVRARTLAETIGRTQSLTVEINAVTGDAHAKLIERGRNDIAQED